MDLACSMCHVTTEDKTRSCPASCFYLLAARLYVLETLQCFCYQPNALSLAVPWKDLDLPGWASLSDVQVHEVPLVTAAEVSVQCGSVGQKYLVAK